MIFMWYPLLGCLLSYEGSMIRFHALRSDVLVAFLSSIFWTISSLLFFISQLILLLMKLLVSLVHFLQFQYWWWLLFNDTKIKVFYWLLPTHSVDFQFAVSNPHSGLLTRYSAFSNDQTHFSKDYLNIPQWVFSIK